MKKTLLLFTLLIKIVSCIAQTNGKTPEWQELFFKSEAVALPKLIDAALKNSLQVERLETSKETAQEQLKLTKKQILNGIGFSTGYSYGTRLNVVGSDLQPVNSFNAFTLPARATYSVGVNMSLGLMQVIGRKHNLKQQENAIKQVDIDQKLHERELREGTIRLYKELALSRVVMLNSQDELQSAKVNKTIAEKRFKEGELQVDEQISSLSYYNNAVLAFEQAKSRYETNLLIMEELIGMSIENLMISK